MTNDHKQIVTQFTEILMMTYKDNIDLVCPDKSKVMDCINIAISSYLTTLFNIIHSHALATMDESFMKATDVYIRNVAKSLPEGTLKGHTND